MINYTTTGKASSSRHVNVLMTGEAGVGKTTQIQNLQNHFNTLIISAEGGLLPLRHLDICVIEVTSYDAFEEAYQFIANSDEAKTFDAVAIDSISEVTQVCLENEKLLNKDPRKAYGEMADKMIQKLRQFRDVQKHLYVTAKQAKEKDEATGRFIFTPSTEGRKVAAELPYTFDEVFVLRMMPAEDGTLNRLIQTTGCDQYIAKDRSGILDNFEAPDIGSIIKKITGE